MTYQLILGNRLYFSWSLAAWLMFENFGLGDRVKTTILRPDTEDGVGALMTAYAPARTLPTAITPDGVLLSDSLAIAEELATRHPGAGHWPADPRARGIARSLACEMHSSFRALRGSWPVNLREAYAPQPEPGDVAAELDRLETLWAYARAETGAAGPWLCGDYSIADAIFAPMATRLATYGFDNRPTSRAYVAAHLADPALRRWRAMGLANEPVMAGCHRDFGPRDWSGPASIAAHAVDSGTPENSACPYSGLPVTHLASIGGRIFGFCNAFCRDKTVQDAGAWTKFMAIFDR